MIVARWENTSTVMSKNQPLEYANFVAVQPTDNTKCFFNSAFILEIWDKAALNDLRALTAAKLYLNVES